MEMNNTPIGIEWERFQATEIVTGYPVNGKPTRLGGMRQAIECLKFGRPKVLPPITLRFYEEECVEEEERGLGDPIWTQAVAMNSYYTFSPFGKGGCAYSPESDESERNGFGRFDFDGRGYRPGAEVWLSIKKGSEAPVVARILDYFLALPQCKLATVERISELDQRDVRAPWHDSERRVFDEFYMDHLCDALELWVEGRRKDVYLACSASVFGETQLEQLAYWLLEDGKMYYELRHRAKVVDSGSEVEN